MQKRIGINMSKLTLEKIKKEWVPGETVVYDSNDNEFMYAGIKYSKEEIICVTNKDHLVFDMALYQIRTTPPEEERWIWQYECKNGYFHETKSFFTESEVQEQIKNLWWKHAKKLRKMEPWDYDTSKEESPENSKRKGKRSDSLALAAACFLAPFI